MTVRTPCRYGCLALLLGGCEPGVLNGVVATPDARIPTTIDVVWDLFSPAGDTWVEYGAAADQLDQQTPSSTGNAATVLGLTGGKPWFLRAVTIDAAGDRWESAVTEVQVEGPPNELPSFTITDVDEAEIDPSAVVFVTLLQDGAAWIVGINREGEYVWWLESEDGVDVPSIHLSADGRGLVYFHQVKRGDQDENGVRIASFDGKTYTLTAAGDGHHDAIQLPDGRVAWIVGVGAEDVSLEDGTREDLAEDQVRETSVTAVSEAEAETVFSFVDDYGHQPWRTCSHFEETGAGGGQDYTHANSLMFDADNDAFLVMSKNIDALVSIDRGSGAVNWQAGGRYGDMVDVDGDTPPTDDSAWDVDGPAQTWWSHGHMSHAWDGGFVVFDNGYHHEQPVSRAVEYALDPKAGTIERVWTFSSEAGVLNPLLGDVRKLENSYLISWTLQGMLTEVTPEGDVVWRASAELGSATGRMVYMPSLYGD